MAQIAVYLDASGSEHHENVLVACAAVSDAEDWAVFDLEWSDIMRERFGVNHFHNEGVYRVQRGVRRLAPERGRAKRLSG